MLEPKHNIGLARTRRHNVFAEGGRFYPHWAATGEIHSSESSPPYIWMKPS